MKARLLLAAMALALALLPGCAQSEGSVGVVRVIDGDTIVISGGATVRYIGIDTPERGEPYYQEALEARAAKRGIWAGR